MDGLINRLFLFSPFVVVCFSGESRDSVGVEMERGCK